MTIDKIQMVPLSQAILCEDCQAVVTFRVGSDHSCPVCGGQAVVNLQRLIEGKKQ